jgi:hypothetical protein
MLRLKIMCLRTVRIGYKKLIWQIFFFGNLKVTEERCWIRSYILIQIRIH